MLRDLGFRGFIVQGDTRNFVPQFSLTGAVRTLLSLCQGFCLFS